MPRRIKDDSNRAWWIRNRFAELHRYIEFNPVRANKVKQLQDYRWSSYASHAQGKPDVILRLRAG